MSKRSVAKSKKEENGNQEKRREKEKGKKGVDAGVVDWARLENEKSGMTRRFESYSTRMKKEGRWQSG